MVGSDSGWIGTAFRVAAFFSVGVADIIMSFSMEVVGKLVAAADWVFALE